MKTATFNVRAGTTAYVMGEHGSLIEVFTEAGPATACRSDIAVVRVPDPWHRPMRLNLPYGAWTEADGARVLFSRDYMPLWRLRDGHPPEALAPWLWIAYVKEEWNWTDANPPWQDPKTARTARAILEKAGIASDPPLTQALGKLCSSEPHAPRTVSEAVARMAPPEALEQHQFLRLHTIRA